MAAVGSYAKQEGESTEQYVDRIRAEAAAGIISSGPGGSLVQSAIDQARGYGSGSRGRNPQQSVSDNFFNTVVNSPAYQAGSANQPVYRNPTYASGGPLSFGTSPFASSTASGVPGAAGGATPYNQGMVQTNAQTAPTSPGAPTTITPGMDPNEFEKARQSILYNLQNPEFALTNALSSKGLSLYNPIIRRGILPAAQGLGTAYSIQGALGNAGMGTDVAGGFQDFINQALSGVGGGIRGVTSGALSRIGDLGNTLWSAANANQAGNVPTNPFIGALLSTLYDPQALMGMETSLAAPNLGPALTSGLQELLGLKTNAAWRQLQPTESFYKYLTP